MPNKRDTVIEQLVDDLQNRLNFYGRVTGLESADLFVGIVAVLLTNMSQLKGKTLKAAIDQIDELMEKLAENVKQPASQPNPHDPAGKIALSLTK